MRFAPSMSELDFDSSHWTEVSLLNENNQDPVDPSDGKFWAYDFVEGGEIRGCMQNPMTQEFGCKSYALPLPSTLLELFTTVPVGSDLSMKGLYFMDDANNEDSINGVEELSLNDNAALDGRQTQLRARDAQPCPSVTSSSSHAAPGGMPSAPQSARSSPSSSTRSKLVPSISISASHRVANHSSRTTRKPALLCSFGSTLESVRRAASTQTDRRSSPERSEWNSLTAQWRGALTNGPRGPGRG